MGESRLAYPVPMDEQDLLPEYEDPEYMEIVEGEQERAKILEGHFEESLCGWCGYREHKLGEHCPRCQHLGGDGSLDCDCGAVEEQEGGRPE